MDSADSSSDDNNDKILKVTESILSVCHTLLSVSDLTPGEKVVVLRNITESSLFASKIAKRPKESTDDEKIKATDRAKDQFASTSKNQAKCSLGFDGKADSAFSSLKCKSIVNKKEGRPRKLDCVLTSTSTSTSTPSTATTSAATAVVTNETNDDKQQQQQQKQQQQQNQNTTTAHINVNTKRPREECNASRTLGDFLHQKNQQQKYPSTSSPDASFATANQSSEFASESASSAFETPAANSNNTNNDAANFTDPSPFKRAKIFGNDDDNNYSSEEIEDSKNDNKTKNSVNNTNSKIDSSLLSTPALKTPPPPLLESPPSSSSSSSLSSLREEKNKEGKKKEHHHENENDVVVMTKTPSTTTTTTDETETETETDDANETVMTDDATISNLFTRTRVESFAALAEVVTEAEAEEAAANRKAGVEIRSVLAALEEKRKLTIIAAAAKAHAEAEAEVEAEATSSPSVLPDADDYYNDNEKIVDGGIVADDVNTSKAENNNQNQNDDNNNNPHAKYDSVLQKSCQTLLGLETMLKDDHEESLFCSEARNDEWTQEIRDQLSQGVVGPKTIVGVLGSTGVGKSSLLNALLDEAAVLPTSGSRGCTAAVVELTYNRDLVVNDDQTTTTATNSTKVPVYKGKVEFMKLSDWTTELKLLVDECSTQTKHIYAIPPQEQHQPDAAAAWAKIDQVYGRGIMSNYHGWATETVFRRLSTDSRVVKLLTPKPTSTDPYNAIYVEEGMIDTSAPSTKNILCDYSKMTLRTRRNLKRWAKAFRSKINDYVYRKGNGNQGQTWPLIRCVQLQGPWPVLSSGGVLVDLPGVRDANAARARVSERYLQNCSQIWVVAPIKRAVDDGTAKELMGEQFKRRLLMDGQYGNIAFICTQTDDCEVQEIMRDHEDVAIKEEGRWEQMTDLLNKINDNEIELSNKKEEEEELKLAVDEAKEIVKELEKDLTDATAPPKRKKKRTNKNDNSNDDDYFDDGDEDFIVDDDVFDDDDDDNDFDDDVDTLSEKVVDEGMVQEMKDQIDEQLKKVENNKLALSSWTGVNSKSMSELSFKTNRIQRRLKGICAKVRNEYSTKCLQEDFIAGLKEMYRDSQDTGGDEENNNDITIPDNLSLPVFCISANDYLKVTGIKPSSDGPPNCFTNPGDTQIQLLREFVHTTTATRRVSFCENFVKRASDLVDRVKLLANDHSSDGGGTRQKVRCENVFKGEMKNIAQKIEPIAQTFLGKAEQKVMTTLKPSLTSGAKKAHLSAISTVDSWGSKSRRSRHEHNAEHNGLYYSTYFATVRRDGVYVSASAGSIDMNAELAAPMETEYTPAWQSIMDGAIRNLIKDSERQVENHCKQLDQALLNGFCGVGVDKARIANMVSISASNRTNVVRASFASMRETATENQRELSRSLLPKVQQSMKTSYDTTVSVPGGNGKFGRMKSNMHSASHAAINGLFDACMTELLDAIERMVQDLSDRIDMLKESISKSLSSVYSILWEDQNDGRIIDPIHQQKVLACRVACLPILNELRKRQDQVMQVLGIEPPVLDMEIAAVETWEQTNERKMQEAIANGAFVDVDDLQEDEEDGGLYNDGNDTNGKEKVETHEERQPRIKSEVGVKRDNCNKQRIKNNYKASETIDLLSDSDDDDDDDLFESHYVYATPGSIGLTVDRDDKYPDGFIVMNVRLNSQLAGKVFVGDILTTLDGRRLKSIDQAEFANMCNASSRQPSRRICILRATNKTM